MLGTFMEDMSQMKTTVGLDWVDEVFLRDGLMVFRKDKLVFPRANGRHLTIWYDKVKNILEFH